MRGLLMVTKPTYNELSAKVRELEITVFDQKQADKSLQESEKKLRFLIETTSDLVWELDLNGVYTYAGPSVKDLLGYDLDEFIGTTIFDSVAHEEVKRTKKFFRDGCKKLKSFSGWIVTLLRKDGQKVTVEISGTPLFDNNGSLSGWCGFDKDITGRKKAEAELKKAHAELVKSNELLQREIEERKQIEKALREREEDSKIKAYDLQEANTALKVLLKHREEDKTEIEDKISLNVKKLVEPYLESLNKSGLNSTQRIYFDILQSNMQEIISPFARKLSSEFVGLTLTEMKVANLVKLGKTSKEIADLAMVSERTVEHHRRSIRQKLGIKKKRISLGSHLLSFS
jgi:PAS domain S-box-containing protein